MKRYYITAEHRSAFLGKLRDLTCTNKSNLRHWELGRPHVMKDEKDVSAIVNLVESWINPFDNQELVSVSTAKR